MGLLDWLEYINNRFCLIQHHYNTDGPTRQSQRDCWLCGYECRKRR